MIERNYGKPDFPIVSNAFDNPNSPKTFSTELENTDTFSVQDIFDLGFLRSNPEKKIYQHKDKLNLLLQEFYWVNLSIKDRVVREILIYTKDTTGNLVKFYKTTKPNIADIQLIIDNF